MPNLQERATHGSSGYGPPDLRVTRLRTAAAEFELVTRSGACLLPGVRELSGYREWSTFEAMRRELPRPWLSLVWELGPPIEHVATDKPRRLQGGFVAGLNFRPGMTHVRAGQHGLCLALDPFAARAVLAVPLGELTDRVVALDDILPDRYRAIARHLHDQPGWAEQFALIERLVSERLAVAPPPHPLVAAMLNRIARTNGTVRLKDLAADAGYSAKHLITCFRDHVGTSPKQFARLVRFHRAQQLLARRRGSVASIAALVGFADQAHLTREFQAFGASTPAVEQAQGLTACQHLRELHAR